MATIPLVSAIGSGAGTAVGEALPQIISDLSPSGQAKRGLVKEAREKLKGVYKGFSDRERTKVLGESLRALGGRENEALLQRLKGAKGAFIGGATTKLAGEAGRSRAETLAAVGGELAERSGKLARQAKADDAKLVRDRAVEIAKTYGQAVRAGVGKGREKGLETFADLFGKGAGSAGDSAPELEGSEVSVTENVAAKALGVDPDAPTGAVVGGRTLESTPTESDDRELAYLIDVRDSDKELTAAQQARLAELLGE
jgi:hypothetical protein